MSGLRRSKALASRSMMTPVPTEPEEPTRRPAAARARRAGQRSPACEVTQTGEAAVPLRLAQLLCSRFCHDLIGPAGAVSAGAEFLFDSHGDPEALDLVNASSRELIARLAFYRLAFGGGAGHGRPLTVSHIRNLSEAFLEGGRVALDWPAEEDADAHPSRALPPDTARLILCLVLIGTDALPRGGTLTVRVAPLWGGWRIVVEPEGAVAPFDPVLIAALEGGTAIDDITARTVHGAYAGCLAASLGGVIEIAIDDAVPMRLSVDLPAIPTH